MINFKQCLMEKDGNLQTAWIENRGAKVGYSVELTDDGSFWNVVEVYEPAMEASVINERSRDFKNHRKATDI